MESDLHLSLCRSLKSDIEKRTSSFENIFWETGTTAFRDLPTTTEICGFKPDLKAFTQDFSVCFLGDAKTQNDIKNKHTQAQLYAFLVFGKDFNRFALFYRVPTNCFHRCAQLIKDLNIPKSLQTPLYINNILFDFNI